jgi:signal peptidase I
MVGRAGGRFVAHRVPLLQPHTALLFIFGAGFGLAIAYETWSCAHGRRSLGKLAFGIKVVGPGFQSLSWGRAFGRTLLAIVASGLILVPFNRRKRALHDFLSGTYVVRLRPATRHEPILAIVLLLLVGGVAIKLADIVRQRYFRAFWTPSVSMMPTLVVGDSFFVDLFAYRRREPARGDVAVVVSPVDGQTHLVKRIVGMPGDTLEIRRKSVLINGDVLQEPWSLLRSPEVVDQGPRDNFGPVTIAPNRYFVLGDHRDRSYDSRFWGPVPRKNVFGKVVFLYWSSEWKRIGLSIR